MGTKKRIIAKIMKTKSEILTEFAIALTLLVLGFALGYALNKHETIRRAQEVLKTERVLFDAGDIKYIAIDEKD